MRKADLELLEMRLEPHSRSIERHESEISALRRGGSGLQDRVKDLERNEEVHKLEIAQGLASIRSLLQRANKLSREIGIIEGEDELAEPTPAVNTAKTTDDIVRAARAKHPGRALL